MARIACLVCYLLIATARKKAKNVTLVVGTQQTLSNLFSLSKFMPQTLATTYTNH
jgi:hypothetical protein